MNAIAKFFEDCLNNMNDESKQISVEDYKTIDTTKITSMKGFCSDIKPHEFTKDEYASVLEYYSEALGEASKLDWSKFAKTE